MPFSGDTLSPVGPSSFGQSTPALRVRRSGGSAARARAGMNDRTSETMQRMAGSPGGGIFVTVRTKVHFCKQLAPVILSVRSHTDTRTDREMTFVTIV